MEEKVIKERTSYDKALDFLIFIAVAVVTIFLVLEVFPFRGIDITKLNKIYLYMNIMVLIIFVLDLIRVYKDSNGVVDFLKKGWLDILATIPFGLISYIFFDTSSYVSAINTVAKSSRVVKLIKLSKAAKISKISKEFKAASHLKKESEEYKKKHRL